MQRRCRGSRARQRFRLQRGWPVGEVRVGHRQGREIPIELRAVQPETVAVTTPIQSERMRGAGRMTLRHTGHTGVDALIRRSDLSHLPGTSARTTPDRGAFPRDPLPAGAGCGHGGRPARYTPRAAHPPTPPQRHHRATTSPQRPWAPAAPQARRPVPTVSAGAGRGSARAR